MERYTFLKTRGAQISGKAERLYKTKGLPHDMSIEQFCQKQGVPESLLGLHVRIGYSHYDAYGGNSPQRTYFY